MSYDYCSNDLCDEYSKIHIDKKHYCDDCFPHDNIEKIQALINMYKVKKFINPSKYIRKEVLIKNKLIKYVLNEDSHNYSSKINPKEGQNCVVNYTGRLIDGTTFDSNINSTPFNFLLGSNQVIKSWELCLPTMSKGEKSLIVAHPDLCYGEKGSPPVIPSSTYLTFDIELLDFHDKPKEIYELSEDEKIDKMCEQIKLGKEAFNDKRIDSSIQFYHKAVDYICDERHDERVNLYNNLSLLYGMKNDWKKSMEYARRGFHEKNNNFKSLYRLANSYYHLEEYEGAIEGCNKILELFPDSENIKVLLKKSKIGKKRLDSKFKNMYNKMF